MRLLLKILLLFFLSGCYYQPTAYFIVSNTTEDKPVVDIKVSIAGKTVFDDSIRYTNIAPDLQYTPYISLPKGKYIISVDADSGKAKISQPISLGNDQWVFISFSFHKPLDSIEAKTRLLDHIGDTDFVNKKLRGSPPSVGIYITDKEPVHM